MVENEEFGFLRGKSCKDGSNFLSWRDDCTCVSTTLSSYGDRFTQFHFLFLIGKSALQQLLDNYTRYLRGHSKILI